MVLVCCLLMVVDFVIGYCGLCVLLFLFWGVCGLVLIVGG